MSKIDFHPDDEVLMDYYQGKLSKSHCFVISAHIEMCNECRDELSLYDAIGGEFLEKTDPISLSEDALSLALARIDRPYETIDKKNEIDAFLNGLSLPKSIANLKFKNRYWAAPGVWIAKVDHSDDNSEAYLMYAQKGMQMPNHDHGGSELTLVLQGSLEDENGKFYRGDLMKANSGYCHSPLIGNDIDCLCFIASEKPIIPKTLLGKMLQPFARI